MLILLCILPRTIGDCVYHCVGSNCYILEDCCGGVHLDANFVTVHDMQNTVNMHIEAAHMLKMTAKIHGAPNVCNLDVF